MMAQSSPAVGQRPPRQWVKLGSLLGRVETQTGDRLMVRWLGDTPWYDTMPTVVLAASVEPIPEPHLTPIQASRYIGRTTSALHRANTRGYFGDVRKPLLITPSELEAYIARDYTNKPVLTDAIKDEMRRLARDEGVTQEDLAQRFGVSQFTVSVTLNGKDRRRTKSAS